MKKKVFTMLIILLFIIIYLIYKNQLVFYLTTNNTYEGDIYGDIISINDTNIKIKQFIKTPCFFTLDYISDDGSKIDYDQIKKDNIKSLPLCGMTADGSLHEYTGNDISFNYNKDTIFYVPTLNNGTVTISKYIVSKDDFIKNFTGFSGKQYNKVRINIINSKVKEMEQLYQS